MTLTKPIVWLDFESTGTDPVKDRITSIAMIKLAPMRDGQNQRLHYSTLVNPGIPIPPEVTEITGITDAMVKDAPAFSDIAHHVSEYIKGCDLGGYNLRRFDVPLLAEELERCGIVFDITGVAIVDAGAIFQVKEPRTLEAALMFYCAEKYDQAHEAMADVEATIKVIAGQMARYEDLGKMTMAELGEFSKRGDNYVDIAGKLVYDKDGFACYNFGNDKGKRVEDFPSFGNWMLQKQFSADTKRHLRRILYGEEELF